MIFFSFQIGSIFVTKEFIILGMGNFAREHVGLEISDGFRCASLMGDKNIWYIMQLLKSEQ